MSEGEHGPRVKAFLAALPYAREDEFVVVPGLGTFRAKHVRRGMERGVVAVHSTGAGFAIVQPPEHGACGYCKGHRGTQPCDHCACAMCAWFRQTDERASPRVSRERFQQLMRRLKTFQLGSASEPATTPDILGDI